MSASSFTRLGILVPVLVATTWLVGCSRSASVTPTAGEETVEVSPAKFAETINRDGLTLVKFGATWCGPCRAVDKELASLEGQLGEVEILKIDVDLNPDLAQQYQVSGIPKLMLVRNGEIVAEQVGSMSAAKLTDWISSVQ